MLLKNSLNLALKPLSLAKSNKIIVTYKTVIFLANIAVNLTREREEYMSKNVTDLAKDLLEEQQNRPKNKQWRSFSQRQSKEMVSFLFEKISEHLKNKEDVKIKPFGSFINRVYKAKEIVIPTTGETVKPRKVNTVRFRPSKVLKSLVKK